MSSSSATESGQAESSLISMHESASGIIGNGSHVKKASSADDQIPAGQSQQKISVQVQQAKSNVTMERSQKVTGTIPVPIENVIRPGTLKFPPGTTVSVSLKTPIRPAVPSAAPAVHAQHSRVTNRAEAAIKPSSTNISTLVSAIPLGNPLHGQPSTSPIGAVTQQSFTAFQARGHPSASGTTIQLGGARLTGPIPIKPNPVPIAPQTDAQGTVQVAPTAISIPKTALSTNIGSDTRPPVTSSATTLQITIQQQKTSITSSDAFVKSHSKPAHMSQLISQPPISATIATGFTRVPVTTIPISPRATQYVTNTTSSAQETILTPMGQPVVASSTIAVGTKLQQICRPISPTRTQFSTFSRDVPVHPSTQHMIRSSSPHLTTTRASSPHISASKPLSSGKPVQVTIKTGPDSCESKRSTTVTIPVCGNSHTASPGVSSVTTTIPVAKVYPQQQTVNNKTELSVASTTSVGCITYGTQRPQMLGSTAFVSPHGDLPKHEMRSAPSNLSTAYYYGSLPTSEVHSRLQSVPYNPVNSYQQGNMFPANSNPKSQALQSPIATSTAHHTKVTTVERPGTRPASLGLEIKPLPATEGQYSGGSSNPAGNGASHNPNASPRPSILRKRPSEGGVPLAKRNLLGSDNQGFSGQEQCQLRRFNSESAIGAGSQSSTESADSGNSNSSSTSPVAIKQEINDKESHSEAQPAMFTNHLSTANALVEASPRKKPRKQHFTTNEDISATADVTDLMEERNIRSNTSSRHQKSIVKEDPDGLRWVSMRQRAQMLDTYNATWKPCHNHFQRYSDVKPKEERRHSVAELSNQRSVMIQASGWKVYHVSSQLEDLESSENSVHKKWSEFLGTLEGQAKDVSMLTELIKKNMLRSQKAKDQIQESRTNLIKLLDHKPAVTDIIKRHQTKRSIKKKDKNIYS